VDLERIISQLRSERERIERAIAALQVLSATTGSIPSPSASKKPAKRQHRLTAEGRKRLSEMMKKRWAERRKKLAVVRKATKKVA
jgi:hypothetical protein